MSAILYLEGGGDAKDLNVRCREGFRKLLQKCGFIGRMPRPIASGGRDSVFDDFSIAHKSNHAEKYVAMWIDSEEPMADIEAPGDHLRNVQTVSQWKRPEGASDDQVLFMTTCMETWIVSDVETLKHYYGRKLQESALPPLVDLEQRPRQDVQERLARATRTCPNAYSKGKRSFEILGRVSPDALERYLPSFVRVRRILDTNL